MGTERFSPVVPSLGDGDDRIQLASQAFGSPVTNIARVNGPGGSDTVKPAGLFSTAPYRPPEPPKTYGCQGNDGACRARPVRGTDLCIFHTPGRGLD